MSVIKNKFNFQFQHLSQHKHILMYILCRKFTSL